MLTAGTFGAGIRRIISDAGGLEHVDRKALARVLGQFEMLFRHYAPAYPNDRFVPGLKFLLGQGCPKSLVAAVSQAWETSAGKRERSPENLRAGVGSGNAFAVWWQKNPDFLASFARLAQKMAAPDPSKSSRRMRQSGQALKVVVPDELRDDDDDEDDSPPDALPESGIAKPAAAAPKKKKKTRTVRRRAEPAAAEKILDAGLADDQLRAEPLPGGGDDDLLVPSGSGPVPQAVRRPVGQRPARKSDVPAAAVPAAAVAVAVATPPPGAATPAVAGTDKGQGSAAIQELIRRSKARVAELTRAANTAAQRARELNTAGAQAVGQLKAAMAAAQQARATMLDAVKGWELARSRVAMLTQKKLAPQKIEEAKRARKAAADVAREAQESFKSLTAGLQTLKENAALISRERGLAVAKAKAAADQRAKLIASAEAQVAAAREKQKQQQQQQQQAAVAVAIPVSGPVVTRYAGPRAPSSPRNVRSGRVVAISPGRAITRSGAHAVPRSLRGSADDHAIPDALPVIAAAAAAATTATGATARADSPSMPTAPPPPPAGSPAARAAEAARVMRDDTSKARSQLDVIERTLEKGPAPYEAFRLYLQRSAILRVTEPDHPDIPSDALIDGMKEEIATARQSMGPVRNAPDWATLIHVWLLSVWGPRTYLMLDQLRLVEAPWQLPIGQRVNLMLIYPPFIWLFRKPRGTGFVRDPRISLLQLDPYACSPSYDPSSPDSVRLTLAWADRAAGNGSDDDARQHVTLEYPVRPALGPHGTLEAVEDFLGDVLAVRTQYANHVLQRLAARRLPRNTFDALLGELHAALAIRALPERVSALRANLDRMLRGAVFHTRPIEMRDAPFTQLIDLALQHKVLVGKDVRRRATRIQQLFQNDDARLPQGMLENVALDFNVVNRSLLADRAPSSRTDKAWDDAYKPPAVRASVPKPWTGIEGDPTSYPARLVTQWAGGELPVPE
ncbi:MAG: hypothetical protein AB7K09_23960 [Planctomycetota bacterium]